MVRLFQAHRIRRSRELSSSLWKFSTEEDKKNNVSSQVIVPSCWENYPDTISYRGKAYYEKEFEAEGNIRLVFQGVGHTATVFVDGEKAAFHYNAYTPFSAVIKGAVSKTHTVTVEADNSFGPDSALHVPNDYQSYGGITRPVELEELGDVYIQFLHVTPKRSAAGWEAEWEAGIVNLSDQPFAGSMELLLNGRQTALLSVQLKGNETAVVRLDAKPCPGVKSWSPESPVLYEAAAILRDSRENALDDLIERMGFREIQVQGRDILLNGEKIRIKGFCRHEDHPQFGSSLPLAAMQQDLLLMKDLGANSVRTSHYPNDELFLDLCDELGILVWEENHARGLSEEAMRNPNFERQCEDCIQEMIEAHYNHPSIYIWGILNECASDTEYGKDCYEKQFALIRSLDGTRPCSFASCRFKTDISLGLVDVVSYNIYPLWYHDTPPKEYLDDLYQWVQNETEGAAKPFLVTEVGAGGIYGYRTPAKVKWSEEYQAEVLEKQLTAILGQQWCSGVYIWQFCDCRVCDSWFSGRPRTMNNKGIVDEYRRPKLAYEAVKRVFRGTV